MKYHYKMFEFGCLNFDAVKRILQIWDKNVGKVVLEHKIFDLMLNIHIIYLYAYLHKIPVFKILIKLSNFNVSIVRAILKFIYLLHY
jgi:hypothetical protein